MGSPVPETKEYKYLTGEEETDLGKYLTVNNKDVGDYTFY